MIFWFILIALAAVVAGFLVLALQRGGAADVSAPAHDLQVYRDQLKGVERDVARGVLAAEEAARVKTEISRRILAADEQAKRMTPRRQGSGMLAGAGIALVLIGGSLALYQHLGAPGYSDMGLEARFAAAEERHSTRPAQSEFEAQLPPAPTQEAPEDYLNLVERLRTVVAERPDDPQGFRLLASSESNLGNHTAAHEAMAQYLELRGAEATGDDWADYARLLVSATGGYVSPEAEKALRHALAIDPANGTARYFEGSMLLQVGRPDMALQIWDALLRENTPGAPWLPPIRAQIAEVAERAGQHRYALPDTRGPSAEDIDAAQQMSAEDRQQMIEGMVSGLAERLGSEGGPPGEWAQLIRALGVLGRQDDAAAIYADARAAFSGQADALALIASAAQAAGVAE